MRTHDIPWCAPEVTDREVSNVCDAVSRGQIGPTGTYLDRFEVLLAKATGAQYVVPTASGTSALHMALLAAGVRPGDQVIVPAWTFVATANAVVHANARPVVVDIEAHHWQIDPEQVRAWLTGHCVVRGNQLVSKVDQRPVRAIVPVHLLGHPADMTALREVATEFGVALVADAAQAIGTRQEGHPVTAAGLAAISFNTNKLVTCGQGGAVLTDDAAQAARIRYLIAQARDGVEYRHGEVGYNLRQSNVLAAIGCAQLERVHELVEAKRRLHAHYRALLDIDGITFQPEAPGALATRWFTTILIDEARFGVSARRVRELLVAQGIQAGPSWTPLHRTGAHRGVAHLPCPVAEQVSGRALNLPCSTTITKEEQTIVAEAIRRCG